jgi:indole-3-glycerol phosphate synthase
MTSDFVASLFAADLPVIMEIKRRDAHGNDLIGRRSIAEIVAAYEAAGAPCISVVTGRWFGGTEDTLQEVAASTDRPLLQKDFVTKRAQLDAARELGVSAVLLTAALLPRSTLTSLVERSLALGLTPFVEVTSEAECAAVPCADACVIAVNNKDIKLREREVADVGRSLALLPSLLRTGTACPVSASGIDRPDVAARLLDEGFAGLLVGTGLLRAPGGVAGWVDELRARRGRPAVGAEVGAMTGPA